mmetsp:Transcript_41374/g.88147  ORF Transcript_41374/g.88147 Transcript_41374/m.88147 type:complete len:534 (-) Transcript_41374:110-1711(-)|eukprot:CAMPEP_0180488182 /NCGR_PEP_ID=MMETSP1036_2-20121128/37917_1 /TAXON_ID=632150 /ORGANISM="Azadinium spinosum, Strain 3D9" /LENGTH=533 /DNA_ID=CAMNT_0022496235 /DNA_START=64 /DNA_END=1665 /DNA_ORIENTATION=+
MAPIDAFLVHGAGSEAVNGLYVPNGKIFNGAPVFENDQKCFLSREPQRNSGTGQASAYGWVFGKDREAFYGVATENETPPASGWLQFGGALPLPRLQGMASVADAAKAFGTAMKAEAKEDFVAHRWHEAEEKWTRAIDTVERFADEAELQVALYSNRSEARLRLKDWDGALDDAIAALQLEPHHEKALLRAAVAARELTNPAQAIGFAKQCVKAHPESYEARQLLNDLEDSTLVNIKTEPRALQDFFPSGSGMKGFLMRAPRDASSKMGFKAFLGYSKTKAGDVARAPLSALGHHHMNLPAEDVAAMDEKVLELRNEEDAWMKMVREDQRNYANVRKEFQIRAKEEAHHGKLQPLEQLLPFVAGRQAEEKLAKQQAAEGEAQPRLQPPKKSSFNLAELSQADTAMIDMMFSTMEGGAGPRWRSPSPDSAAMPSSERKQRMRKAKTMLSGGSQDLEPNVGKHMPAAPEPKPLEELVRSLKSLVTGENGMPLQLGNLDEEGKRLVNVLSKYDQDKGNAEAEKTLRDFSYLVHHGI